MNTSNSQAMIIGLSIIIGLGLFGILIGNAAINYREYERTVNVKGLSEKEFEADIVIWPIQYTEAGNNLEQLYRTIDKRSESIAKFLIQNGIQETEISYSTPSMIDKSAQQYGNQDRAEYRFIATQTVTVYSNNIQQVRIAMNQLSVLGKKGIVFTGNDYQSRTEYLFTRLNEVKPDMIEEATRKAREVAEKFASDSKSSLGKIKQASQGQFSISDRDKNNPHIKKVRVVSTIEYYLSD